MPTSRPQLNEAVLQSVATQLMTNDAVTVDHKMTQVRRSRRNKLRTVSFEIAGHTYDAIEQNPDKPSRWGQLARDGHQVVQFKDAETNRFVAVAVDGGLTIYGR